LALGRNRISAISSEEQEFGVLYSDRGTRELLYHLELSFTAPTYTLAKADPAKQEAFKQDFEELKKNS
jgi:putative transposase